MTDQQSNLEITDEKDRANKFISSIIYSRATVFHPSTRHTQRMKDRLVELATSGGIDPARPLESVEMSSYGRRYKVDLHVEYLLQTHRNLLETIFAYGQTIKLDDESYNAGKRLNWKSVLGTVEGIKLSESQPDAFDVIADPNATVFSISMYEIAKRLGKRQNRINYDQFERLILQLSAAKMTVSEFDENDNIIDVKTMNFIQDYRLCYDSSKIKNNGNTGKGKKNHNLTNHVFIVPDVKLIRLIAEQGYYYRLDQRKMLNYKSSAVQSFIKWITTHKGKFLNTKKLDWLIDEFLASIASPVSVNFRNELKKSLIADSLQLEKDFDLQIRSVNGQPEQVFYVGDSEVVADE